MTRILGAVLIGLSVAAFLNAARLWRPCFEGVTTEACLYAMDNPTPAYAVFWIVALAPALVALPWAPKAGLLGVGILLFVNPIGDYAISSIMMTVLHESPWDAPIGLGFPTAVGIAATGIVIIVGGELRRARRRSAEAAAQPALA